MLLITSLSNSSQKLRNAIPITPEIPAAHIIQFLCSKSGANNPIIIPQKPAINTFDPNFFHVKHSSILDNSFAVPPRTAKIKQRKRSIRIYLSKYSYFEKSFSIFSLLWESDDRINVPPLLLMYSMISKEGYGVVFLPRVIPPRLISKGIW